MTTEQQLIKARRDAAAALQRVCFRAVQQKGFVTLEDCQEVTDLITVAVVATFSTYINKESDDDQYAAH